jgi:hypothetical protein
VELYTYATDCKGVVTIPGSHFVKAFSALPPHFNDVSSVTKAPSLECGFQSTEQAKISCSQVRIVWGMFQCCHIALYYVVLDQNSPVCWSIVVKEKPTVDSPFFGAFLSDRIPKATKDLNARSFINSFTEISPRSNYRK